MSYKDTVFLPRNDFPMRAGLPTKEPQILQQWQDIDIYKNEVTPAPMRRSSCMMVRPMRMVSFISATPQTKF